MTEQQLDEWVAASLAYLASTCKDRPWTDAATGGGSERTAAMRDSMTHEHSYNSQVLRHSHPDGDKPHAYFGHPEDFPPEVSPDELYNGELLEQQS